MDPHANIEEQPTYPQLDQLASLARTALSDPASLPDDTEHNGLTIHPYDLNRIDTNYYASVAIGYAIDRLDDVIETLNPSTPTAGKAATALRTLGRHIADVADQLQAAGIIEERSQTAAAIVDALDALDLAIQGLEEEEA